MFWNSIGKGFSVLLDWRILLVVTVYSLIMFAIHARFQRKVFVSHVMGEKHGDILHHASSYSTLRAIVDSVLIIFSIFLILPILMGAKQFSSFSDMSLAIKTIAIITLIAIGIRVISAKFLTFDSSILSGGGNITTYFICVGVIIFIMKKLVGLLPVSEQRVFPSFWTVIGFSVFSWIILLVYSFVIGIVASQLKEDVRKGFTERSMMAGSFMMAIVFMRMYCYYILEKIQDININWDAI